MTLFFSCELFSWYKNYDIYDDTNLLCYKVVGNYRAFKENQPIQPNDPNDKAYDTEVQYLEIYDSDGLNRKYRYLNIHDINGKYAGKLKYRPYKLNETIEIYIGDCMVGKLIKKHKFFKPYIKAECSGWRVIGDWKNWNYNIVLGNSDVAQIKKDAIYNRFEQKDIYSIDVIHSHEKLLTLLMIFAVYSLI